MRILLALLVAVSVLGLMGPTRQTNQGYTGFIAGGTRIVTTAGATHSPTGIDLYGTWHIYTNAGVDVTLPTAVAGMNACFYDADGGAVVILDAAAGDEIILDGAGVAVADAIDSAGDVGDFVCLMTPDGTNWYTTVHEGTWVDGGAD